MLTPVTRAEGPGSGQFVGREAQLAALNAALAEARDGRGTLFLVGGEPGIGKSRLADTFARGARESGARVLWGKCWEGAGAPAYWPWIQALRAYIRNTDREQLLTELGRATGDLVRILPELGDLVGELPLPGPETDSSRFQLFDSTADFLRRIGSDAPTVLILDDLHSADTPSILLLRFVAQQIGEMGIVAIGTYRDIELTPDHPMTQAVGELTREPATHVLALHGMSEAEVRRLVEIATGRPASSSIASRLWRETGGNPLFVSESLRLLTAEGRLDDDGSASRVQLTLPSGVREVITRRAQRLSDPARRLLRDAAAIGPEFAADLLARLTADGDLAAALAEAVKSGLALPIGGGRYRFSHDLVREALYEDIDGPELLHLHRRIADALEEMQGAAPGIHAAELAYHYFEAAAGAAGEAQADDRIEIASKARDYARLAADQAAAALAYEEASRLYQMALDALALAGDDVFVRTELLLKRGEFEARSGELYVARDIFLQAAGLARATGQSRQLAMAALGYGGRLVWARSGGDTRLPSLLQEALVLLGGEDDLLRVRLLARLACSWRSDPEQRNQGDVLSTQALDLARRMGDPPTIAYATIARFYATWWPENPERRAELANEMLTIATELGDGELLMEANLLIWLSLAERGRMVEAKHRIDDVNRLAEQLRQPGHIWLGVGGARVPQALLEGRFDIAREYIPREILRQPVTIARDDVSAYRMHRFLFCREQGCLAESEPDTRAAVEEFPWYPCHRAAHVITMIELGRTSEARAEFTELARDRFSALYPDNEWLLGMALASEAASRLHDTNAAQELYEQLVPFAGRHAAAFGEGSMGVADRYLGLLAETLGRPEAEAHYAAAIQLNEQMGARAWVARVRADYARMLRDRNRAGDVAKADELETAALDAARSMGMPVLVAELQRRHLTEPSEPVEVAAAAHSDALFLREGEYWSIGFGADNFKLRDSKGLQYLAALLAEPGREFLALDLAREAPAAEVPANRLGDAGAQLDAEAKSEYRARLHELQADLDEAEAANDVERAEKARDEMEFLGRELARAVGLSGRDRTAGSASERARLSVTRAIRLALDRIAEHSPVLGDHLNSTIRTGTYCSYRPDTRLAIDWQT